jgi:hypothetical protein
LSLTQPTFSPERQPELEAALERVARKVVSLQLELPATLLLEMHLPVLGILHAAGLFFEPIASPLFGAERIHTLKLILSERKNIEELIRRIESNSIAKAERKDELYSDCHKESSDQRP